jgi:hypothetical protein
MTSEADPEGNQDARDDLHATSESIQDDAERIGAIEAEKNSLDASDPRVSEMSDYVEQLSRNMAQKATNERALSKELQDD